MKKITFLIVFLVFASLSFAFRTVDDQDDPSDVAADSPQDSVPSSTDPQLWTPRQPIKLKQLARRSLHLKADQKKRFDSLPKVVAAVAKDKQTILMKDRLAHHKFGDEEIASKACA